MDGWPGGARTAALSFAFLGVGLAALTHDPVWDAFGTLAIGALLAVVAVVLGIEMCSLLLGEAASPSQQEVVRQAILGTGRVARVAHLRTMYLGPDEVLVVGGLELDRSCRPTTPPG